MPLLDLPGFKPLNLLESYEDLSLMLQNQTSCGPLLRLTKESIYIQVKGNATNKRRRFPGSTPGAGSFFWYRDLIVSLIANLLTC